MGVLLRLAIQDSGLWKKDKEGKDLKPWITRDVVNLVEDKNEAYVKIRKLKSDEALEERKSRKNFKPGMHQAVKPVLGELDVR